MKFKKFFGFLGAMALIASACACTEKPVDPVDPDVPVDPQPEDPTPAVTKYTVTFNTNGGSQVNSIEVEENKTITLPAAPTKAGFTFAGWYTDAECNTAYSNAAITGNITLYAKWTENAAPDPDADKVKIATTDDFIAMLKGEKEEVGEGSGLVEHYILTADLDFTGIELGKELGQTAYSFQGILDGRGYTISNLTLIREKKQVGLFEGLYAAVIKNINFKDVEISNNPGAYDEDGNFVSDTSDCRGVSLLGNYVAGNSELMNISIDGFKVYTNTEATKVEESAGLVVNAFDTVYLDNIAITGIDAKLSKNSGLVIASMKCTTDSLKVAGATVDSSSITPCQVIANNILLEGTIVGAGSDSQGMGGLIGRCDNFEDGQSVQVNGFVFSGSVQGTKNNGPLLGNNKQADTPVTVKNAYFLEGEIASSGLQSTANPFIGQYKSGEAVWENCYYVDRLVQVRKTVSATDNSTKSINYISEDIATAIKAADVTAITDAFTVADGKITLCGLSVDIPTDVVVADVALATPAFSDVTATPVDNTTATISGEIPYYSAASEAGAAGNFVAVKFTAAAGVDTTGAYYVYNNTITLINGTEFTLYVPVAALAEGVTERADEIVSIRWNNTATDQVFTLKFGEITLAAAPVYGGISQDVEGLTAANPTDDKFTLAYTAGEIPFDTDGNYVTVKVEYANFVTTVDANYPVLSDAATLVSNEEGYSVIKVKVTSNGAEFTVKWSETTDPQTYKITIGEEVTFEEATSDAPIVSTYELDGAALYTELGLTGTKNLSEAATYSGFTLSKAIRIKSDSLSGNKYPTNYAAGEGYISFEVVGVGELTVTTANDDRPIYLYKIVDETMLEENLIGVMSDGADNKVKEKTFSNLEAGKYIIAFNGLNPTLTDGKLAVEAKVKTLKLVDTVTPAATPVAHTYSMTMADVFTEVSALTNLGYDGAAITALVDKFYINQTTDYQFTSANLSWLKWVGNPTKGYFRTNDDLSGLKRMGIASKGQNSLDFTVYGEGTISVTFVSTGGSNINAFAVQAGDSYLAANEAATAVVATAKDTVKLTEGTGAAKDNLTKGTLYSYTEEGTSYTDLVNVYAVCLSGTVTVTFDFDFSDVVGGQLIKIIVPETSQGRGVDVSAITVTDTYAE